MMMKYVKKKKSGKKTCLCPAQPPDLLVPGIPLNLPFFGILFHIKNTVHF